MQQSPCFTITRVGGQLVGVFLITLIGQLVYLINLEIFTEHMPQITIHFVETISPLTILNLPF